MALFCEDGCEPYFLTRKCQLVHSDFSFPADLRKADVKQK